MIPSYDFIELLRLKIVKELFGCLILVPLEFIVWKLLDHWKFIL